MKWDRKSKRRLYDLFMKRADDAFLGRVTYRWGFPDNYKVRREWICFMRSIGVECFDRPLGDPWTDGDPFRADEESPAEEESDHILLLDPTDPSKYRGLKIPKEVAEKILVFGIP